MDVRSETLWVRKSGSTTSVDGMWNLDGAEAFDKTWLEANSPNLGRDLACWIWYEKLGDGPEGKTGLATESFLASPLATWYRFSIPVPGHGDMGTMNSCFEWQWVSSLIGGRRINLMRAR